MSENLSVTEQLNKGIALVEKSCGEVGILAYFQEDTSTAGEISYLKRKYSEALQHEKVIGLIVSTRPDFLSKEITDLFAGLDKPVTIEIGMQSRHDKSLKFLNRGHDFAQVEKAITICGKKGIEIGVHLILGIPGESLADMRETILYVTGNRYTKQVKFHNLVVYEGTPLQELYRKGNLKIPSVKEYIPILGDLIAYLRGDIVITRLFTSNIRRTQIAADRFRGIKTKWMNELRKYIVKNKIIQGCKTDIVYDQENIKI